jgi:glucuronosyltransferase
LKLNAIICFNYRLIQKEFEDFIAKSGDAGFVYISFGSAVQISVAPPEISSAFFEAIRRLKVHFVWKWEGDLPKEIPPNVFMSKWMPQQDILGT